MNDIRIGITTNIKDKNSLYWLSDEGLSVFSLYDLLIKTFNVTLLNIPVIDFKTDLPYLDGYSIEQFDDKFIDMDLIIVVDGQPNYEMIKFFKNVKSTNKVISYKSKNDFLITNEEVLNNDSLKTLYYYEDYFDEVWYYASHYDTNKNFYSVLYKTDIVVVPFIWQKKNLDVLLNSIDSLYDKNNESIIKKTNYIPKKKKTIGIIEQNKSVTNTSVIPLMIAEQSFRKNIDLISKVLIDSGKDIKGNKRFISLFRTFDLFVKGKIKFEHMYNAYYVTTQFLDVIISHQLLNPFNPIILDMVYMGYPILHNSYMCKDLGYYYEGSDINSASQKLDWILENHDKNINEYILKNSDGLQKYYVDNPDLLTTYEMLIKNLFDGKKKNTQLTFDVEKNDYI